MHPNRCRKGFKGKVLGKLLACQIEKASRLTLTTHNKGATTPFAYTILDARISDYDEMNECKDLASGPISECYDCDCPSNKKLDCGIMGITEEGCVNKGCAWCPSQTPGVKIFKNCSEYAV